MATTDAEIEQKVDRAMREADAKLAKDRLDKAIGRLASAAAYVEETTAEYIAAAAKVRDGDT